MYVLCTHNPWTTHSSWLDSLETPTSWGSSPRANFDPWPWNLPRRPRRGKWSGARQLQEGPWTMGYEPTWFHCVLRHPPDPDMPIGRDTRCFCDDALQAETESI